MTTYEWMRDAACAGSDPNLWFPGKGKRAAVEAARAICAGCPVIDRCMELGMTPGTGYRDGVYGGRTAKERRDLKKEKESAR